MRLVVCVKYVPTLGALRFDPTTKRLVREGVPGEVSSFDLRALGVGIGRSAHDHIGSCRGDRGLDRRWVGEIEDRPADRDDIDTGRTLEHLHGELQWIAWAARAIVELARIGAGARQKLLHRRDAGLLQLWKLSNVTLCSSHYAVEEARINLVEQSQRTRLDKLSENLQLFDAAQRDLPKSLRLQSLKMRVATWSVTKPSAKARCKSSSNCPMAER